MAVVGDDPVEADVLRPEQDRDDQALEQDEHLGAAQEERVDDRRRARCGRRSSSRGKASRSAAPGGPSLMAQLGRAPGRAGSA